MTTILTSTFTATRKQVLGSGRCWVDIEYRNREFNLFIDHSFDHETFFGRGNDHLIFVSNKTNAAMLAAAIKAGLIEVKLITPPE